MVRTSMQLKALIRNLSGSDSAKAQMLARSYAMERFLARLSQSEYRDSLILKGGCLLAAIFGKEKRSTMDIDFTTKKLLLNEETAKEIVGKIAFIHIGDGIQFEIKRVRAIMTERDYEGINIKLDAILDNMHIPFEMDMSTGDVITPKEITYKYETMFAEGSIAIKAYNLETVIAEKMLAVLVLGITNTRMRDFYDLHVLDKTQSIDAKILSFAFENTCKQRRKSFLQHEAELTVSEIIEAMQMQERWERYRKEYDFAQHISWGDAMASLERFHDACFQST